MSVLPNQTNITKFTILEPEPVVNIIPLGTYTQGLSAKQNYTWNFDTSGNSFIIRTSVGVRPYRYYMIYYTFTVTSTVPIGSLTACALELIFGDTLGVITSPLAQSLPLNATVSGNLLQFQIKYSNSVTLFADYPGDPQASPPGLTWRVNLVKPAGLEDSPTGYAIEITDFSCQEIGIDYQAEQSAGLEYNTKRRYTVVRP